MSAPETTCFLPIPLSDSGLKQQEAGSVSLLGSQAAAVGSFHAPELKLEHGAQGSVIRANCFHHPVLSVLPWTQSPAVPARTGNASTAVSFLAMKTLCW